jgi:hypothetical protein
MNPELKGINVWKKGEARGGFLRAGQGLANKSPKPSGVFGRLFTASTGICKSIRILCRVRLIPSCSLMVAQASQPVQTQAKACGYK